MESVQVTDRSRAAEAHRKAANDEHYGRIRAESAARKAAATTEPATAPQLRYLSGLAKKAGREQFDAEFGKGVEGTDITPHGADEETAQAVGRLTKATAGKLITALTAAT